MARICIATLDPAFEGGVPTMARFVYEVAEAAGHNPYLAYNRVDLSADVRPWDLPRRGLSVDPVKTTVNGMEARHVPRALPEFEFLHYVLNGDAWGEIIADADVCFGVGGNNQCCHPFVREDRTFGCWAATPMWEDRTNRLEAASLPLRIRDRLSKPLLERIENRIYDEATVVYVLSEYTARRVAASCDVDRADIEVVPYPVDTNIFSPARAIEETDGGETNADREPTVLFVGRYNDPRKNTPAIVEAFARIHESVPDARLQLIGDEPDADLRQLAKDLGVASAVEFIDHVPNEALPAYYRGADVFAIPSHQEGLAIVGLEAMACGTPIVATRCGGPEDYVKDGESGYLVPTDDVEALAARLQILLTDSTRCRSYGQRSREIVEDEFSREQVSERFEEAFDRLGRANH